MGGFGTGLVIGDSSLLDQHHWHGWARAEDMDGVSEGCRRWAACNLSLIVGRQELPVVGTAFTDSSRMVSRQSLLRHVLGRPSFRRNKLC